jgi:hypothetical protein
VAYKAPWRGASSGRLDSDDRAVVPPRVDRRRTADNAIRVVEEPEVVAAAVLFAGPGLVRDPIERSPGRAANRIVADG